jgi:hypothetical protein
MKSDWFLIFFPLVVIILSLGLGLPYLVSILLFYFLPGCYIDLMYGTWRLLGRHLLFSLVVSVPFAVIVDFIGTSSHLWYVPHSVFGGRFLGILPYEDFFWMIAATYAMVTLYDYFKFESKALKISIMNRRMWRFVLLAVAALGCFFVLVSINPALFIWNTSWTYVLLGLIFFALPALVLFLATRYEGKSAIPVVIYFFYFTLTFEIVGSRLKDWLFLGNYLLPRFTLFGTFIPSEELLFVGIIGPLAAIGFYEYFDSRR